MRAHCAIGELIGRVQQTGRVALQRRGELGFKQGIGENPKRTKFPPEKKGGARTSFGADTDAAPL